MKKVRYILFILLMLLTINVNASSRCDSGELKRLKELAKKVEFDYDYKVVDDIADFTINATNLNKELKVLIIENYYAEKYREFKGGTSGSLSGFKSGERVVITIKGYVPNGCSGETVLTKTIKLPYYNLYYDWNKCETNEDFKYCKYLLDKNITQEEFNKQFDIYIDNKIKQIEEKDKKIEEEEQKEKNDHTKLYMTIGIMIVVTIIISVISVIIVEKRKKNRL